MEQFDDIEIVNFDAHAGIPAADLTGGTTFQGGDGANTDPGLQVVDYDDVLDRDEEAVLLWGWHQLAAFINSTETADGSLHAAVEISSSPSFSMGRSLAGSDLQGNFDGRVNTDDDLDVLGRALRAFATGPFSDGASGVGGGGTGDSDEVTLETLPIDMARFHPRDELFVNLVVDVWNVDDAGIHTVTQGQHIYGIRDFR